jgi:hypothetical protein
MEPTSDSASMELPNFNNAQHPLTLSLSSTLKEPLYNNNSLISRLTLSASYCLQRLEYVRLRSRQAIDVWRVVRPGLVMPCPLKIDIEEMKLCVPEGVRRCAQCSVSGLPRYCRHS